MDLAAAAAAPPWSCSLGWQLPSAAGGGEGGVPVGGGREDPKGVRQRQGPG